MSTNLPEPQPSEEVDLGQLFKLIGKMFDRFFKFIASIFIGLFNVLMLFLIFIKQHIVKFVIAGIVGVVIGFYLDRAIEPSYISTMVVEPNFKSAQQLYNNIEFYNELAASQDSVSLGDELQISPNKAATIKAFFVNAYIDENQKIKLYDGFVKALDTATQKHVNLEGYLKDFNPMDSRFHMVSVIATNNLVAKEFQDKILEGIVKNPYFEKQRKTKEESINFQEVIYQKQLTELDSLQALYKNVMLKEADNPLQGTSISLADTGAGQNKEMDIINERNTIKDALVILNIEKANKTEVINIISNFPNRGAIGKDIFNKNKILVPLGLIAIVFLFYVLLAMNRYLDDYKK